jgi:hypothetical protein
MAGLAKETEAKVSRPSKTRSALSARNSSSETEKVVLNAHSASPIPVEARSATKSHARPS